MGKSNFNWGAPSMSDDIFNNLSNTYHKEKTYDNSLFSDSVKGMFDSKYERPFEEKLVRNNDIDYKAENTYELAGDLITDNHFADKTESQDDNYDDEYNKDSEGYYILPETDYIDIQEHDGSYYSDDHYNESFDSNEELHFEEFDEDTDFSSPEFENDAEYLS